MGRFKAMTVVGTLALVATAAGCGGRNPAAVVVNGATVYRATVGAASAEISVTSALTSANGQAALTSTASGSFSWSAQQGRLTARSVAGPIHTVTTVITDGAVSYSRTSISGLPTGSVPGTGSVDPGWSESTWSGPRMPAPLDLLGGGFADLIGGPAPPDPSALLATLRSEATGVREIGTDSVDGTTTRHYRGVIPLGRLGAPPADEKAIGATGLDVDYWIDPADRLRRLHEALTIRRIPSPPATTTTTTADSSPASLLVGGQFTVQGQSTSGPPFVYPLTWSTDLTLTDFGVPVRITIPPATQITSRESCAASRDGFSCDGYGSAPDSVGGGAVASRP